MGYYDSCLEHHGILGQKWGIRRFQRKDGTLTPAGRKRIKETVGENDTEEKKKGLSKGQKIAIGVGVTAATVLAAYGGYKLYQINKNYKNSAEGLTKLYTQKADAALSKSKEDSSKALDLHGQLFNHLLTKDEQKAIESESRDLSKSGQEALDLSRRLREKAESKDFSRKEKLKYAIDQERQKKQDNQKSQDYNSSLQSLLDQMTKMAASNKTKVSSVSKQQEDYTQELLKKNSKTLSRSGIW